MRKPTSFTISTAIRSRPHWRYVLSKKIWIVHAGAGQYKELIKIINIEERGGEESLSLVKVTVVNLSWKIQGAKN